MPAKAEPGDRVAVTFVTTSSCDSGSSAIYENEYGGYQFFEWIYTWQ